MTYHVCISYITRSSDGQAELIWVYIEVVYPLADRYPS